MNFTFKLPFCFLLLWHLDYYFSMGQTLSNSIILRNKRLEILFIKKIIIIHASDRGLNGFNSQKTRTTSTMTCVVVFFISLYFSLWNVTVWSIKTLGKHKESHALLLQSTFGVENILKEGCIRDQWIYCISTEVCQAKSGRSLFFSALLILFFFFSMHLTQGFSRHK